MIRAALFPLLSLAVLATPRLAHADEAVPCSKEAKAVKKMKKRDPSLADPKSATAKEHLEAAKRAYGVQQYDKAIEEYTAAGLDDDAPLILYDLGQTYRAAKEYEKAIRQYELFLDRGKPGEKVTALIECHIATMKAELEHAAATAPPSGPASDPSGSAPDEHSGAAGVGAAVPPDEDEPIERARPSMWTGARKVAVGLAVIGVGGLATGIVFGAQAQGLREDAARLCPSSPCANADEANALADRADTRSMLANVSYGLSAAVIAGAVVLWFVGAPSADDAEAAETALVPQVGAGFAGIAYGGRF